MSDIEVSILTKIKVHPNGSCGQSCPFRCLLVGKSKAICILDGFVKDMIYNLKTQEYNQPERLAACLAAQKEAEGMIWSVIGIDVPKDGTEYQVLCGKNKTNFITAIYSSEGFKDVDYGKHYYPKTYSRPWWIGGGHDCIVRIGDRFRPVPQEEK